MNIKCGCGRVIPRGTVCSCRKSRRDKSRFEVSQKVTAYWNRRWKSFRARYLANNPLCVSCDREGNPIPATELDHKVRPAHNDDPLFWDLENLQGLCKDCHKRKTADERRIDSGRLPIYDLGATTPSTWRPE